MKEIRENKEQRKELLGFQLTKSGARAKGDNGINDSGKSSDNSIKRRRKTQL